MRKLTVREAAALLGESEENVVRWIRHGLLPAYRIHDQYRINPAELLEWATARRMHVSPQIFAEPEGGFEQPPALADALRAGGIHYRVEGRDKASVLRAVVERIRLPEDIDREFLCQVLLAREALGSTAIGDGIAIPHVRNPIVLHLPQPIVTLCFLAEPVDFGALDGQPIRALFTLISPTVRIHLHLLSRLAFALRTPGFLAVIRAMAPAEEILAALRAAEAGMTPPRPEPAPEPRPGTPGD